jgi:hypothetical protein
MYDIFISFETQEPPDQQEDNCLVAMGNMPETG